MLALQLCADKLRGFCAEMVQVGNADKFDLPLGARLQTCFFYELASEKFSWAVTSESGGSHTQRMLRNEPRPETKFNLGFKNQLYIGKAPVFASAHSLYFRYPMPFGEITSPTQV